MYARLLKLTYQLEQNSLFVSIKKGLMLLIPVLVTGSIALMLQSLPIPAVREFVEQAFGGALLEILNLIYDATFGMMAVYLLCGISFAYAATFRNSNNMFSLMAVMASLGCFIASFGTSADGTFQFSNLGAVGVFTAILCAIAGTALFYWLVQKLPRAFRSYAAGVDGQFREAVAMIMPLALCILIFALFHYLVRALTGQENLNTLLSSLAVKLFHNMSGELGSGALFVTLLNSLWFFGLHGGNVLEQVAQSYFVPANTDPAAIVGKSFLDNFALLGGCGTTLCLLLALLLFSKNTSNRKLAWSAAPFAAFNMNELLVFGLPVILNPVMLVPFLLTPLLSLGIAYFATATGFLPVVTQTITWTTPGLFSGYAATGSVRGVIVQIIILAAGTALYAPFVRLAERLQATYEQMQMKDFLEVFWRENGTARAGGYLNRPNQNGVIAKAMAAQLREDIRKQKIPVWYQPQVDEKGAVVGAEALLRWQYHGMAVPPPVVVALAQEDSNFTELTACILETAAQAAGRFQSVAGDGFTVSVNVTAGLIDNSNFIDSAVRLIKKQGIKKGFCLEVTEEDTLANYDHIESHLKRLRKAGIGSAIDDFSMGHTSLKYLQNNDFQYVKLDGALVRQLAENQRCQDIVRSIISLGSDLGFQVVAEYVENETLRSILIENGCAIFQGFLYSPAVPEDEILKILRTGGVMNPKQSETEKPQREAALY